MAVPYGLALIADADFVHINGFRNREIILFGSESLDSYVKMSERSIDYARFIVELMRKEVSKDTIAHEIKIKYPRTCIDLDLFISKLADAGLLVGSEKIIDDEMELVGIRIFHKSFSRKDTASFFMSVISAVYRIFSKAVVWIPVLLVASILLAGLRGFSLVVLQQDWLSHYVLHGIALVVMTVLCFLLHECGHAVAAIANGVKPKDFSFGVYLGIVPTFYFRYYNLKTASSLTKLKIVLAGVYSNLLFALLSFSASCLTGPPLSGLLLELSILNILMIIGNMMPMRLSDGYYVISLILERFDIRISFWRGVLGLGRRMKLPLPLLLYFIIMIGAIAGSIIALVYRAVLLIDQENYVFGYGLLVVLFVMFALAVLNIVRKRARR